MSTTIEAEVAIPYRQLHDELVRRGFDPVLKSDRAKFTRFTVDGTVFYLSNILGANQKLPVEKRLFAHVGVHCDPTWRGLAAVEAMRLGEVWDRPGSNFRDFPPSSTPRMYKSRAFELRSWGDYTALLSAIERIIRGSSAGEGVAPTAVNPSAGFPSGTATAKEAAEGQVGEGSDGEDVDEQGYEQDPKTRAAVEKRAVDLAKEYYRKKGAVSEVGKPYDLDCYTKTEHFRVEVKGSKSTGDAVFLTRKEVEHARCGNPRVELFVVSGILVDKSRDPYVGTGGEPRVIRRWRPKDDDLEAIQFRYRIPVGEIEPLD